MKKALPRLACLILALAMVFSLATAAFADDAPKSGGTLKTYWSEFYNEYDPSVNDNRNFVTFYTDMLWNVDWYGDHSDYNYTSSYLDMDHEAGQIAESWEIADDYTSMTVKIREDVTFQDKTSVGIDPQYDVYGGRGVKASDIKYTYDRIMGFEGMEPVRMDQTDWPGALNMLESVEVVDDYTVKFNFNTDNVLAVSNFMSKLIGICGPEWDELSQEQKSDWHYAAGTGPFILKDYVNDNTMTFVKNPGYWDTDPDGNPLPYLDEIQLISMRDTATMLSQFVSGNLDILAANNILIGLDQAATIPTDMYHAYSYVGDSPCVCIKIGNNPVPALDNARVREALQYAIPLEEISAYKGYVYGDDLNEKAFSLFLPALPHSDVNAWPEELIASYTTFDPEYAKQVLEEEGFGDGFEFDVYLFQAMPIDSFQIAAEYLAQIGVTMNITVCATPPEMAAHGGDANDPASMYGNTGMDMLSSVPFFFRSDGFMNNSHQHDDEIDALCDAFVAATSLEEQVEAAKALDVAYMSGHYLLLVSYGQQWNCYYNNRVHGFHGELYTKNYWAGFMFARAWVD